MSEEQMTEQIQAWEQQRDSQPHEVAAKFLCEARSLLRAGKDVLAERKRMAAFTVLGGSGGGGVTVEEIISHLEGLLQASHPDVNNDEMRLSSDEREAVTEALRIARREVLVQDVIRSAKEFAAHRNLSTDLPFSELTKRTVKRVEARAAVLDAACRLAEQKP